MKTKTTKKATEKRYDVIISVGYCNLQRLLQSKTPKSYTFSALGWDADIYDINGIAIVTGYRPFGNIKPDYDTCRKYEVKAEKLRYSDIEIEKRKQQLNELIAEFIKEVLKK